MMARRNMTLGRRNSKPDYMPWQMGIVAGHIHRAPNDSTPDKRIIKGRPLEVDFDRSHQRLQQGAPS